MKNKFFIISAFVLGSPLVVSAATHGFDGDKLTLYSYSACLIEHLAFYGIFIVALFFLSGVYKFVVSGDDKEKRAIGRKLMIKGVIAIFITISIWCISGYFAYC